MFDIPIRHCRSQTAGLAVVALLAATSLVTAPAHAFGLKGTQFVEGLGMIGDALESAEEAELHDRSNTEQFVDDKVGEIADQAADRIEQGSIRAGGKAWDALVKSDSKVGELAKKAARRWGPAVRKGPSPGWPRRKGGGYRRCRIHRRQLYRRTWRRPFD